MSKIVRYEFVGNWLLLWLMCISGIGIPAAILYLLQGTIRTDEEVEEPNRFLKEFRAGRYRAH